MSEPAVRTVRPADAGDAAAEAYYLANKEGIDSWNAYVAEHGLPLADLDDD